jgi:hypothetical protein
MSNEGFLRRWSRLKAHGDDAPATAAAAPHARAQAADHTQGAALDVGSFQRAGDIGFDSVAQTAPHPPVAPPPASNAPERPTPTLDDVARLGPDSDFSAFVSQGVDKNVQRLAMRKLFSDPHFHVMDGLDIYIDDYNKSDPVPAAMLASLQHAKSVFAKFIEDEKQKGQGGPDASPGQPDASPDPPPQDDA